MEIVQLGNISLDHFTICLCKLSASKQIEISCFSLHVKKFLQLIMLTINEHKGEEETRRAGLTASLNYRLFNLFLSVS